MFTSVCVWVCVRERVCVCVCACVRACSGLSHVHLSVTPGSCFQGIFQAITLEQVAISYSRGYSSFRDGTHVSCSGWLIPYHCATWYHRCLNCQMEVPVMNHLVSVGLDKTKEMGCSANYHGLRYWIKFLLLRPDWHSKELYLTHPAYLFLDKSTQLHIRGWLQYRIRVASHSKTSVSHKEVFSLFLLFLSYKSQGKLWAILFLCPLSLLSHYSPPPTMLPVLDAVRESVFLVPFPQMVFTQH